MGVYGLETVFYCAFALVGAQLGRLGECRSTVRNVYRDSHLGTFRNVPVARITNHVNICDHNVAVPLRRLHPATVTADTPSEKEGTGVFHLVSQTYRTLKERVATRVHKLLENRRQALASTHPLRHQRWRILLHRKTGFLGLSYRTEQLVIEFMEDGSLKTDDGHEGSWWSEYGDVVWKIYFDPKVNVATYFNAQLCWNNFGESAFMRRGVVFQDRPPDGWLPQYLFRPVLGKFTGEGIV